MMQFTPDQSRAIFTHDRSLVVSAGAGSGKTRVLVERYMALLEAQPSWELSSLVAITFTHKAAQEMRDRVRSALMKKIEQASDDSERALWSNRLATMDSARIDTIHALCATLLRSNAAESEIDPRFQIIEPYQADGLRERAIDQTLSYLFNSTAEHPIAELFKHYELYQIRETISQYIEIDPSHWPTTAAEFWRHWQQNRQELIERTFLSISQDARLQEFIAFRNRVTLPNDKMGEKIEQLYQSVIMLRQFQRGANPDDYRSVLTDIQSLKNHNAAKIWKEDDDLEHLRTQFSDITKWLKNAGFLNFFNELTDIDRESANLTALWMQLFREVHASYTQLKQQQNVLDFNDLETLTARLLKQNKSVRERYIRREFKHVLVDEFQDTNEAQWEIIQSLTIKGESQHTDEPAPLFVVGDPKQSIYGFRGADVSVFNRVRQDLVSLAPNDGQSAEIPLAQSFRSHEGLVDTFNMIFSRMLQANPGSLVSNYEVDYGHPMMTMRSAPDASIPPLTMLWLDKKQRDATTGDYIDDGKVTYNSDEMRLLESLEIAKHIKHMVEVEQRPIFDRDTGNIRPIQYGDFALLFRVSSSFEVYEDVFRQQDIPYVTYSGRGYYSRQEVWDLQALLETLHNPYDDLALATILRSPMFALSDEALLGLRLSSRGQPVPPLWDELAFAAQNKHPYIPETERQTVANAHTILAQLHQLAGRVSVYELLQQALARTGYLAILTALPDGHKRRANVEKLLDQSMTSGKVTLSEFTRHLQDLTAREVREGEAETDVQNAVTLMTVHSSKGLEFPLVILPDMTRTGRAPSQPVHFNKDYGIVCNVPNADDKPYMAQVITELQKMREDAENKRLLYVAMTRAQDYLLLSSSLKKTMKSKWSAQSWTAYLLDVFNCWDTEWDDGQNDITVHGVPIRVHYPLLQPIDADYAATESKTSFWQNADVQALQRLDGGIYEPPLTQPAPVDKYRFIEHLTTTQIADLGAASYDDFYSKRFRQQAVSDAPAYVRRVRLMSGQSQRISHRIMGDVVHGVLHHWDFQQSKMPPNLHEQIESHAWQWGIVAPDDIAFTVQTATDWLTIFSQTMMYRYLRRATQLYRELPFVYRTERRIIHGIIDVLFQRDDGTWVILDYKSSFVHGYVERSDDHAERESLQALKDHTQRYELQVGVYAAATLQYLATHGIELNPNDLKVHIYYLRYGRTVQIPYERWGSALANLENQIGKLIEDIDIYD